MKKISILETLGNGFLHKSPLRFAKARINLTILLCHIHVLWKVITYNYIPFSNKRCPPLRSIHVEFAAILSGLSCRSRFEHLL
jgi:hypothetical protein